LLAGLLAGAHCVLIRPYTLRNAWMIPCSLLEMRRTYQAAFAPEVLSVLGVFIDNHVGLGTDGGCAGGETQRVV